MLEHECTKIAMEFIIGQSLDLEPNDNRGHHPTEMALALLELGYAMTMYESVLGAIDADGKVQIWGSLDLIPEEYGNCMVEVFGHAIAFKDGEFWDNGIKVDRPEVIVSVWVPTIIKSN